MVEIVKKILLFFIVFLLVYILDFILNFKKLKKYDRKKLPVNINYLVLKYKIDVVKLGYKRIAKILSLADSFIIAFLFTITNFIDNIYIRLLVCFILIFPLFAGIYYLIAKHYRKNGD